MKRTIAIVAGGDSSELVVSLRSAQGLYSFIDISFSHLSLLIFFGFLLYSAGIIESPSSSQYLFVIG